MQILKNRNERKAFHIGNNAYKKAKKQAKQQGQPLACYLTLQMMNILQKEAMQNLFVWHKLQELKQREKQKQERIQNGKNK